MSNVTYKRMYYELSIGGRKLTKSELGMIQSIEVFDATTGSDSLTVNLSDNAFNYIGAESLFVEDKTVSFRGGWSDDLNVKFEGYVSVVDLIFPETGSPSIVLHCMDNTHLMNRKEKQRTWEKKRESDVVSQIFKEYGLKAVVTKTKTIEDTITQSNNTDIEFLISLADKQEDDYIIYVEGKTGYFIKKPSLGKSQMTLSYKTFPHDIVSFTPRINKEKKKEEVEKSNVNTKTKKKVTSKVSSKSSTKKTQGKPVSTSSKKVGSSKPVSASSKKVGSSKPVSTSSKKVGSSKKPVTKSAKKPIPKVSPRKPQLTFNTKTKNWVAISPRTLGVGGKASKLGGAGAWGSSSGGVRGSTKPTYRQTGQTR